MALCEGDQRGQALDTLLSLHELYPPSQGRWGALSPHTLYPIVQSLVDKGGVDEGRRLVIDYLLSRPTPSPTTPALSSDLLDVLIQGVSKHGSARAALDMAQELCYQTSCVPSLTSLLQLMQLAQRTQDTFELDRVRRFAVEMHGQEKVVRGEKKLKVWKDEQQVTQGAGGYVDDDFW
ncbi:hypothetical protein EON65_19595 [archaeon]|nr:MAG: hypothetical protein EON65_19595 [archaeon]